MEQEQRLQGEKRKPRMYWGEPRYEGQALTIYPRRGVYTIGTEVFPLKPHSENRSYSKTPRMYFGNARK